MDILLFYFVHKIESDFLSCRRFEDIPNPYYIPYPYKWNQPS